MVNPDQKRMDQFPLKPKIGRTFVMQRLIQPCLGYAIFGVIVVQLAIPSAMRFGCLQLIVETESDPASSEESQSEQLSESWGTPHGSRTRRFAERHEKKYFSLFQVSGCRFRSQISFHAVSESALSHWNGCRAILRC